MTPVSLTFLLCLASPGEVVPPSTTTAPPQVGLAAVVQHDAKAQQSQNTRALAVRDPVYRNERLVTGADPATKLHVRLLDDTVLTLGPSSEMVLDDFAIDPKAGTAEVQVSLSKGLLRFAGGKHGSKDALYRVKTPVATIGIRGTTFDLKVEDDGGTSVLLAEGEIVFENEAGDEVIIDEPNESSSLEEGDSLPSEPEIDPELAAEFDELDLSPEQQIEDAAIAEEMDSMEVETVEGEDPDTEEAGPAESEGAEGEAPPSAESGESQSGDAQPQAEPGAEEAAEGDDVETAEAQEETVGEDQATEAQEEAAEEDQAAEAQEDDEEEKEEEEEEEDDDEDW